MSGVVPSWQINHEAATSWPDVGRAESPMPSESERANMRVHSMDVKCANFAKYIAKLLDHSFLSFVKNLRIASAFVKLLELLNERRTPLNEQKTPLSMKKED